MYMICDGNCCIVHTQREGFSAINILYYYTQNIKILYKIRMECSLLKHLGARQYLYIFDHNILLRVCNAL